MAFLSAVGGGSGARTLTREYNVETTLSGETALKHQASRFAAKRLAWCLSAVSPDRVVSTLYSLVNVLAPLPPPTADRNAISLRPRTALTNLDQNTVSSSISLTLKTDDQRQQIYSNVIEAISEMVVELANEKVAELMISLLGQKFGRVNNGVDKSLIWGLAKISSIVKEK